MKTDRQIQRDVLRELHWDRRTQDADIGVEVDRGFVSLSGTVSDGLKKDAAQEAAYRVAGVLDVVNDIQVRRPGSLRSSDTDLAHGVRRALDSDVAIPLAHIHSTVSDGWVTLEGEVQSCHEREAAERAVRNLAGVHGVFNRLTLTGSDRGTWSDGFTAPVALAPPATGA
jgi:osmotically-inducible protein OsmY